MSRKEFICLTLPRCNPSLNEVRTGRILEAGADTDKVKQGRILEDPQVKQGRILEARNTDRRMWSALWEGMGTQLGKSP